MGFKKMQADFLFTGTQVLPAYKVLICDEVGQVKEIIDEAQAGEDIQRLKGLLTPGFINCHCHLELSHMKGLIPEKTGLVDFVFAVVTQRHFPEDEILAAIENAEKEMLQNGIVAVGDICNNLLTLQQKRKRNFQYYNFVEASGWLPDVATPRFERSKGYYDEYAAFLPASIVPHAPYSVSDNLWKLIKPFYKNKVVSIHNQETAFEDELFLQNTGDFTRMYEMMKMDTSFFAPSGKSSLQTYFGGLEGAAKVILVHNTFTQQADISYIQREIKKDAVSFCLCVNANQYIEQSLPPVDLLRKNQCNIVLGTDSLASNWSLSILDEIKTIQKNFNGFPLAEVLGWATVNGAKALQMNDQLGSFKKGKKPGVVLLEGLDIMKPETIQSAKAIRIL